MDFAELPHDVRYGTPLAYAGPLEIVAQAGLGNLGLRRVADFGYGTIGHRGSWRAWAPTSMESRWIRCSLFSTGRSTLKEGRNGVPAGWRCITGRWPADAALAAEVGTGYDLFLSKNTLENGYIHPAEKVDPRMMVQLGVDDSALVRALAKVIEPRGLVLVYTLSPAPATSLFRRRRDSQGRPSSLSRARARRSLERDRFRSGMTTTPSFQDRPSAGRALADAIEHRLQGHPCHVYGLARGGVLVARPVAERLDAKLDVLLASKIAAPGQPEYAVGALAEGGGVLWDGAALSALGLRPAWQESAAREVALELERRRVRYRRQELPVDPEALALVVDDGVATGATVRAALRGLAALGARRWAVATPVASREAVQALEREAEWVVALIVPDPFLAVGAHYLEFEPVGDDELMRALESAA